VGLIDLETTQIGSRALYEALARAQLSDSAKNNAVTRPRDLDDWSSQQQELIHGSTRTLPLLKEGSLRIPSSLFGGGLGHELHSSASVSEIASESRFRECASRRENRNGSLNGGDMLTWDI
jgi:hypothetical protein